MPRTLVKELLSRVLALNRSQRHRYLDEACPADGGVRAEVDRLIEAADNTEGILDRLADPTAAVVHALTPGDSVGRFKIIRLLGRGGMGEVYLSEDQQFGGLLALKTIRPDLLDRSTFAARFEREIRLARRVTHPNVCRVFDVGSHARPEGTLLYLTMELLEGETLSVRLKRGPLYHRDAVAIFSQVASGLAALHEANIVHRDLKPGNIFLARTGTSLRCVITDFGLAYNVELAAAAVSGAESLTLAGELLGTPSYMSPEQLTGKTAGCPADVYSIGLIMYESLTGQLPFAADHFIRSAAQKLAGIYDPPSHLVSLDKRWDALIGECLQVEETKRPSIHQVLNAVQELTLPAQPGSVPEKVAAWRQHTPRRAVLVGTTAVLIGAAAFSVPVVKNGAQEKLCEAWPGLSAFCQLPARKDVAVFPFAIKASSASDRALATGISRYFRESFARLAPDPDKMCIHIRPDRIADRIADGVKLVLEGEVQTTAGEAMITASLREPKPREGRSAPLLLRQIHIRLPLKNATELHTRALKELASAFGIEYRRQEWDSWLASGPKFSESFVEYLQGVGYLDSGDYETAASAFNTAIDPARDFAFAPAHVGLGDAYRFLRNKTGESVWEVRARKAYARALPFDETHGYAGTLKRMGELDASSGQHESAIQEMETALRLWPFDHLLMKTLAGTYEAAGHPEKAETVIRDATKLVPNCWLTHNTLSDFLMRHGRFREAEQAMLEGIRVSPDNATAYHNLALIYIRSGRYNDAIDMDSRSIRIRQVPLTYSSLGRALVLRGCNSDGLLNLRQATKLQPSYFVLWANLAEALSVLQPGGAETNEAVKQTLELVNKDLVRDPTSAYAHVQRAIQLARLGQKKQALEEAQHSLKLARGSQDILVRAAEAMKIAGYEDEAAATVESALKAGLSLHDFNSNHALQSLRQHPRLAAALQRAAATAPDPGDLSSAETAACPESQLPGQGLKKIK